MRAAPDIDLGAATERIFDELVDTRRAIHATPELGFTEHVTTALIRARCEQLGLRALPCPTETGAIYELSGGLPGRSVMLRADIDALPIQEEVDVPWRSRVDGLMHACGHDGHAAMVLGAARLLADRAESLAGRFVFLFQPAEELAGGAVRMIEGGAVDTVAADRMLSIHLSSLTPLGQVVARPGVAMSHCQRVGVVFRGAGGHGALAGSSGNVVLAMASVAIRLADTVLDMEFEEASCAASAGQLHAGTASNVVPREARLAGTIRTFTADQATTSVDRLRALIAEVSAEYEVEGELDLPSPVPPVVNDAAMAAVVHRVLGRSLGPQALVVAPPVTPSDDVAEFLRRIPGCHFHVGARPGPRLPPSHHTPTFNIDEQALGIGARLLAEAAVEMAHPG